MRKYIYCHPLGLPSKHKSVKYIRSISHLNGDNKISERKFECSIKKNKQKEEVAIWDVKFHVTKFVETCEHHGFEIKNTYYVDNRGIVRRSSQYHSETIGYVITERLDR